VLEYSGYGYANPAGGESSISPIVKLLGYAQSNARVSTLMRNIEASPWLELPELVEVKANSVDKRRVSDFDLNLSLKRTAVDAKDAGKPAVKDAAKKG